MSFGFSVSWASQEEHVSAGGGNLSQLVESQALSVGLVNSSSGGVGEFQSAHSETLRELDESVVIGDGTNNGNNSWGESVWLDWLFLIDVSLEEFGDDIEHFSEACGFWFLVSSGGSEKSVLGQDSGDSWQGDGVTIEPWLVESFVNSFVELWIGSSLQERVKLN